MLDGILSYYAKSIDNGILYISGGPDIRIRIYFYTRIRKRLLIHIRIRIGKTYGYLIEKYNIYRILLYEGEICIM